MTTDLKRITISVPQDLDEKLDKVKKEHYYVATQSDMIRELIALGLDSLDEEDKLQKCHEVSA